MLRAFRSKRGFTLVELMVVAVIVAILAVVLVPMMTGNKKKAYATEAVAALGTIRNALRVYHAEHAAYPVNATGTKVAYTGAAPNPGVQGIEASGTIYDLDGTYFSNDCYSIESTTTTYTITCDWSESDAVSGTPPHGAPKSTAVSGYTDTTTLNQDGTFGGTY